jgi:hypothetical protein
VIGFIVVLCAAVECALCAAVECALSLWPRSNTFRTLASTCRCFAVHARTVERNGAKALQTTCITSPSPLFPKIIQNKQDHSTNVGFDVLQFGQEFIILAFTRIMFIFSVLRVNTLLD